MPTTPNTMIQPTTTRKPPNERIEGAASQVTEIEERFTQLQAQFDNLRAQVRQVQQLGSLGKAAAMFAHEVNNLLTPILSYSRAAVDSDNEKLRQKALSVTHRNQDQEYDRMKPRWGNRVCSRVPIRNIRSSAGSPPESMV